MYVKRYLILFAVVLAGCSSSPSVKKVETKSTDDISDMKARLDDLNNRVYVLTEQMESLRSRLRDSSTVPSQTKVFPQAKATVLEEKNEDTMVGEYKGAYELYKDKKYSKALIAFSSFIEKYPNTVLTDNAYYWMADCYYNQKEYALSIDGFTKVLKKFPNESKAPEAMLKIAMAYKELGEKKDADAQLKELISKFPVSRAAYVAKNMVESNK